MHIHEYQAKSLLRNYGIQTPNGYLVTQEDEIEPQARRIGTPVTVVKAQVHAGGRGKGGGVRLTKSLGETLQTARNMLGTTLITPQTGPQGVTVNQVYLEEGCSIEKEYYLSLLVDRTQSDLMFVASAAGGMSIEETAAETPEQVIRLHVDPQLGLLRHQADYLITRLQLPQAARPSFIKTLQGLVDAFMDLDAAMIEINPLVLTQDHQIVALDAKVTLDDNAAFRHPRWEELRDDSETDPREVKAAQHDLAYVALDGQVGCLVNGAGLAMATMDAIRHEGGEPANFLDVGGSATQERVQKSLEIILEDAHVKGIFVNVFGGIMQCDTIAKGLIGAANAMGLEIPLVVRLEGNRMEAGNALLESSGLQIQTAGSLDEGARKIVALVQKEAL